MEFYVGCGLRCKLDGEGIKKQGRPPVKLAIVLDISGSMRQEFRYGENKSKLQVAIDCVMTLLDNLQPTDSFGLVAFDDVHPSPLFPCNGAEIYISLYGV
jgi:hypothetical protein